VYTLPPMMPAQFTLSASLVGALLLIVAALGGRIFGSAMRSPAAKITRAVIAVLGGVLLMFALLAYLGSRAQQNKAASVAALPTAKAPVDLVQAASFALQSCPTAVAPAVPDGASASLDQMKTAQSGFQAYDAATNAYVKCVDAAVDRIAQQSGTAAPSDLEALRIFGVRAHNTAIDQEQAVVDQFNGQVRTYKAKHPKS
jgi:hypothetical protein